MAADRAIFRLPQATLDAFGSAILQAAGVPPEDAALVAHGQQPHDARGLSSHGVVRLLPVYVRRLLAGTTRARPNLRIVQQRAAVVVLDGDAGLGQVVGQAAMGRAIAIAREIGIGAVAARHSSHFGIAALFAEQAVAADMVGVVMTNAPANMPPHGGRASSAPTRWRSGCPAAPGIQWCSICRPAWWRAARS
jgi:LDH2 family malate/lactate/ureidoglycolate dehydrogenase